MKQIAGHTGNTAMTDGNVPPHITVAAFDAATEELAAEIFRKAIARISAGNLHWVSVGTFLPSVIYITPVLNEYLQSVAETLYKEISCAENVTPKGNYGPYTWLPHATLGKYLDKEQMRIAFKVMQEQFAPFGAGVVKCGLAKTNPYTDIITCELKKTDSSIIESKRCDGLTKLRE